MSESAAIGKKDSNILVCMSVKCGGKQLKNDILVSEGSATNLFSWGRRYISRFTQSCS